MKTKLFTVEEANQLLPRISVLIEELSLRKLDIQQRQAEIDVLELLNQTQGNPQTGVTSPQLSGRLKALEAEIEEFRQSVRTFQDLGCEMKDLEAGLVDFQARRGDQIVYLCWKKGEPEVGHWHPIEGGYATRKPL